MKDKKGVTITNAFQKSLDESTGKRNKIWRDKRSEFYNRSVKSWLQDNNIETFGIYKEGKPIVPERFIRTLKNKMYKYTASISKKLLYLKTTTRIIKPLKRSLLM